MGALPNFGGPLPTCPAFAQVFSSKGACLDPATPQTFGNISSLCLSPLGHSQLMLFACQHPCQVCKLFESSGRVMDCAFSLICVSSLLAWCLAPCVWWVVFSQVNRTESRQLIGVAVLAAHYVPGLFLALISITHLPMTLQEGVLLSILQMKTVHPREIKELVFNDRIKCWGSYEMTSATSIFFFFKVKDWLTAPKWDVEMYI